MFFKKPTMTSTTDYSKALRRLRAEIGEADAIVLGAGAGLSTAAGFRYAGANFHAHFHDFEEQYGFHDMYTGGFYPYDTLEEYWAYWSRYVLLNRYQEVPSALYQELRNILQARNCFVITTNVDHCFQKAGFDKERLFYTQGNYGLFQCSTPCHSRTYDNETAIRAMVTRQKDMKIPSACIPRCPKCGRAMTMNLRSDKQFVEDAGWSAAASRYHDFLEQHAAQHSLFLELGVGYNTPAIIKYPFWNMTQQNHKAVYACVNVGNASAPREIARQSICIAADIATVLHDMQALQD